MRDKTSVSDNMCDTHVFHVLADDFRKESLETGGL